MGVGSKFIVRPKATGKRNDTLHSPYHNGTGDFKERGRRCFMMDEEIWPNKFMTIEVMYIFEKGKTV